MVKTLQHLKDGESPSFLQKGCMHPRWWTINSILVQHLHPRSSTVHPWKMMAKEDDPFLLKGSGNFSGAFAVKLPGGTRGSLLSHSGTKWSCKVRISRFFISCAKSTNTTPSLEVSKWPSCRKKMLRPSKDCGCIQATCKILHGNLTQTHLCGVSKTKCIASCGMWQSYPCPLLQPTNQATNQPNNQPNKQRQQILRRKLSMKTLWKPP